MSSQEAAAYHGGLWGASPTTTSTNLAVPAATTTYGVLRMSGGEMLHGVSAAMSPPDVYMHWNLPQPTATTTTTTTMKIEETTGGDIGAFQAREMSDVIENIIRQQQHPATTLSLATVAYSGLQNANDARDSTQSLRHQPHHHHHQQQQQHGQLTAATTGTLDTLQLLLDQTVATTVNSGSTHAFVPSLPPPLAVAAGPAFSSLDAGPAIGMTVDAQDWINHLSDDLANDRSAPTEAGHAVSPTSCHSDEGPDAEIEAQVQASMSYWLHPDLPDENVMLADRHWDVLNRVVPAYNRFIQFGTNVNRKLKIQFDVSQSSVTNQGKSSRD